MATKLDELYLELKARDEGLAVALNNLGAKIDGFEQKSKKAGKSTGELDDVLKKLRSTVLTMGTVWAGWKIGKGIVEAGVQMQALDSKMVAATGSASIAAEAMAFVRREAERLGLDFKSSADGFASFSASALRAGLTFAEVQEIFSGVSEAATGMRLSSERTQLVFMALSQMASKGVVSMEELRQQLGESLPGALQVFSKAMGVSDAAFIKMIENGEVTTKDLIKLGRGLKQEFGGAAEEAANSAQAAFNRMGNAFFELQSQMAESGFLDAVTDAVRELTDALNDPATIEGLRGMAELIGDIVTVSVRAASAIGAFYSEAGRMRDAYLAEAAKAQANGEWYLGVGEVNRRAGQADFTRRMIAEYTAKKTAETKAASGAAATSGNAGYTLGAVSAPASSNKAEVTAQRQAEQLRERLASQVDTMRYGFASPEQQAVMDQERDLDTLREALEAKAITEQEFRDLSLQSEIAYQEELARIRQEALEKDQTGFEAFVGMRIKSMEELGQATLQEQAQSFRQTISQAAQHNKAFFMLDKAAALARAVVAARESVVNAYNFGSRFGPHVGAAFAAVAAAAQAANIASIASASYGSSGGVSSAGGGSASAGSDGNPANENAAEPSQASLKTVHISLHGYGYSKNDMRELINGLNEAMADGSQLKIVGVNA